MFVFIGCNDKEKKETVNNTVTEKVVSENITENEGKKVSPTPTPVKKLKPPKTKEEIEDAFGKVNDQGKWIPPEGSYVDPKTGNILNKDGIVIGNTKEESCSVARPGSQGQCKGIYQLD